MTTDVDAVLLPGFVGTTLPDWVAERLRGGLAGVCLYGENVESAEQVTALVAQIRAVKPDALVAIDEEGGDVTRLHYVAGSPYPGAALLGRIDDLDLTAGVGAAVAGDLAAAGVDLNLAPVADVNSDPRNPVIGVRSFGADAGLAARHVAAFTAAHEAAGVATSVKHFPGHGDTAADSHLALPVVDVSLDVLRARDLPPFRAAIEAGARTVMTSHILLPQVDPTGPATFSSRILGDLLRGELGFGGVIVSDALDMAGAAEFPDDAGETGIPAAAARALAAGCDLLCLGTGGSPEQLDAIGKAVSAIDPARLDDAAARVAALVASLRVRPVAASWSVAAERLSDAFAVADGAVPAPDAVLVVVETTANIAVGFAPWGPAAAGATVQRIAAGEPLPAGLAPDAPVVLVAKDVHRHPEVAALADVVRVSRPGSLIVDMGWPSGPVDVATYGASRGVGLALLHWLRARGWRG